MHGEHNDPIAPTGTPEGQSLLEVIQVPSCCASKFPHGLMTSATSATSATSGIWGSASEKYGNRVLRMMAEGDHERLGGGGRSRGVDDGRRRQESEAFEQDALVETH